MMLDCVFKLFIKVRSWEIIFCLILLFVFFFLGVIELSLLMKMIEGLFFLVFLKVFWRLDFDLFVILDMIFGLLIRKKKVLVLLVIVWVMRVLLVLGGLYMRIF